MQSVEQMNGTAAILEGINIDNALGEWVKFKDDMCCIFGLWSWLADKLHVHPYEVMKLDFKDDVQYLQCSN
jgi:hypothetical protein